MITIKNTQKKIGIDKNSIKQKIEFLLDTLKYKDFDLFIWFTSNKNIRFYNNNYRKKDKATDIISFPYHPTLAAGKRIKVKTLEDKNLGDILISPSYVEKEALKYNQTFEQRINILLVHGICHLLGYDHIVDADYRRMRAKEAWLLKKLNIYISFKKVL